MLALGVKIGDYITIGEAKVVLAGRNGNHVRLQIHAPSSVIISRQPKPDEMIEPMKSRRMDNGEDA